MSANASQKVVGQGGLNSEPGQNSRSAHPIISLVAAWRLGFRNTNLARTRALLT
jgi:hypothetical protein